MALGGGISQEIRLDGQPEVVAKIREIGTAYEQSANKIAGGNKNAGASMRSFNRELTGMQRGAGRLIRQFSDLGRATEILGGFLGQSVGGVAGGFLGVGAFKAVNALVGVLDQVIERQLSIQKQAREAGVRPLALQAAGRQAEQAGKDAEVGQNALTGFAAAVAKAKAAMPKEDTFGVKLTRGDNVDKSVDTWKGIVQVFEGGKPKLLDFSNAVDLLNVNIGKIKTPEDLEKAIPAAITRALELAKRFPMEMNQVSQNLFKTDIQTLAEINKNAASVTTLAKELAGTQQGLTKEREDQLNQLRKAQKEVDNGWRELGATVANAAMPGQLAWDRFQVSVLGGLKTIAEEAGKNFNANTQEQQRALANFAQNWQTLQGTMLSSWQSFWSSVTNMANQAGAAIRQALSAASSALPSTADAGGLPSGFAAGGMVRGPGSATSDSIMARLSNGEFVMRASAVRHWGAGLLASMNTAAGGLSASLVPKRPGRFADGGLVTAGSGTPVHLHLGGHSFALSGSEGVVSALVTEAHRQRMRSAGTKPSWYGGH